MGRRGRSEAERWERPAQIANGQVATVAQQRKRTIYPVIGLAVVCLVGALVSAIVRHLLGHHSRHPAQHLEVPWQRRIPGLAVMLIGVAIVGRDLLRIKKANGWFAYLRSQMLVLTGPERRQVVKQVRGKAPVDVDHLPVLREVAREVSRQRALAPLLRVEAFLARHPV